MSFHTGHGGGVVVDGTTILGVQEWQFTKTARLAETTNAESGGIANWLKVLVEAAGSANIVWEDTQVPDTDVTLDAGDSITALRLDVGDTAKFYSFAAIVESLQMTNNNLNDAVKFTVNWWSNGAITDPVT